MTDKQNPRAGATATGVEGEGDQSFSVNPTPFAAARPLESINVAIALAERGIPVFPCRADKRPRTANGFHDATTDADTIRAWWDRNPDALVAVPTGNATGLMVLDLDPEGEQWAADHPEIVMAANRVHYTPRGMHYLFMYADGVRNSAGRIAPGVDIRGDGGYIVWWPAHGHESFGEIEELTPAPDALTAQITASRETQKSQANAVCVGDIIPTGQRDNALTSLAGTLRRKGLTADEMAASLRAVNDTRCQPPVSEADIQRIANSVARYEAGDPLPTGEAEGVEPFDLSTATVGDLIETPPPQRPWLIHEHLPLGTVGILAAAGGTGKSFAILQLGVSAAAELPWLGMNVDHGGSVLIVSAEDDREEIHRRLHAVLDGYREDTGQPFDSYADKLRERLYVLDRVGEDNRMTAKIDREAIRTGFADRVIATAGQLSSPVLIVLDPLARFDGGEPNDNADGTRLIECAEYICKHTGATVLVPHHVSKASIRDEGSGQEGVRGASGLVDGARWVGMLATMKPETAKRYGIDEEQAPFYVRYTRPKANGAPPWGGMWLHRRPGGVLVPVELQEQADAKKQQRGEVEYAELVRRIRELIGRKGPMPKRRIEDHYGGTTNVLKAGQHKVRDTITRALEEGALVTRTCPESRADLIADPNGQDAAA